MDLLGLVRGQQARRPHRSLAPLKGIAVKTLKRLWTSFRALPAVMQGGCWLVLAFLGMLAWPAPAHAADLAVRDKDSGAELRIMESACSHAGTLALIPADLRPQFKNARVLVNGMLKVYGCWSEVDDVAVIIYENGFFDTVPMKAFTDPMI